MLKMISINVRCYFHCNKGKRKSRQKSNYYKNPVFSTSFGSVTFTRAKYRTLSHYPSFSQNLVPHLFTPPLPPISISHQLSRQRLFFFTCFLYFFIIIFYRLLILASAVPPPPPPPPSPASITVTSRRTLLFGITVRNAGEF